MTLNPQRRKYLTPVASSLIGTGFSGWYLNPSSQSVFYYSVNDGEWANEFEHISEEDYKDLCARLRKFSKKEAGIKSSVPVDPDVCEIGEEGWYCDQGMKCTNYVKDENGNLVKRE